MRRIGSGRTPAAVVLLLALAAVDCGRERSASVQAGRPRARILLVGIDGADWRAVDPLIAQGRLPAFAALRAAGRTGILLATPPLVSPIIWTTIATGRRPEDHGVLDFTVDRPAGGQAPIDVLSRNVPALWNLFSDAGLTVAIVGWWATWPAEELRGTLVSDRAAPQLVRPATAWEPGTVSPAAEAARLRGVSMPPDQVSDAELAAYAATSAAERDAARLALGREQGRFYADRIAHLMSIIASTRSYVAMLESLLRRGQPDLAAIYLEGVDTVSHLFIQDRQRGARAIAAAYADADAALARLARAVTPDTLVVVCSDHGFHGADAGVREDASDLAGPATAWHRPYGIVAVAEAGALAGRAPATGPVSLGTLTPLDITPTLLHAAGLAVGTNMPGRVVMEMLPPAHAAREVKRAEIAARAAAVSRPTQGGADEAMARLRALGYVGTTATSLARQNLGEILYRAGKLQQAERHLRAVAEGQPENLAARLWLAKALQDQGRGVEAWRVYTDAMRIPEGPERALVEAVELAVSAGLRAEAATLLANLPPKTAPVEAHVARAVLAQSNGNRRLAEQQLRGALALDPTCFDALFRLLDLSLPGRRAGEALGAIRTAARHAPGSPRHVALLGTALLATGRHAEAEGALRQALELAPDGGAIRLDLARAQLAQGKAAEARATLLPAPGSGERSTLLGAAASALGEWQEAAEHFAEALHGSSPSTQLWNGLGWAEHKRGRNREAAEALRRSLELEARQPAIRRLLAQIEAPEAR